jgi:hypothetical protein
MRNLTLFTLASVFLASASCRDSQQGQTVGLSSEGGSLTTIHAGLVAYEMKHGRFPRSLSELVKAHELTPEEVLLRRLDGSLQSPDYFPDAKGGTAPLLAFDRGDGQLIVVQVDGAVRGAEEDEKSGEDPGNPFGAYLDLVGDVDKSKAGNNDIAGEEFHEFMISTFKFHASTPNIHFTSANGQELMAFKEAADGPRVGTLLKELNEALMPSEETEGEDWVQIRTPEFDSKELRAFILFPDIPKDNFSPFHGIRIYNKAGEISEWYFSTRVAAAAWVKLMEELQASMKKCR